MNNEPVQQIYTRIGTTCSCGTKIQNQATMCMSNLRHAQCITVHAARPNKLKHPTKEDSKVKPLNTVLSLESVSGTQEGHILIYELHMCTSQQRSDTKVFKLNTMNKQNKSEYINQS